MKKVFFLGVLCYLIFTPLYTYSQIDSITQKREVRKLIREGNDLYRKQKFTDASVAYKKALHKSPNYKKNSFNLGNALYKDKNYSEAATQFEHAANISKDKNTKAKSFHNLGDSYMGMKQYQKAVDAYKKSLSLNPKDDETRYNLAVAQKKIKELMRHQD